MPPSPALRYSPGREARVDNHKRGRSLEGGLLFKEKEDDLALFNEMQSRERANFLLQSTDDFDDTFSSKLRYFSDFKLGISIPVRGESSELLDAEGEKNDYDCFLVQKLKIPPSPARQFIHKDKLNAWLVTPPDTPLFTSLDDEPPPVNVASRGRPRSQPISISRSSTMEKSYRSSRGSASPNRSSPSPRSGSNTLQSRGRPSSAPHSSPAYGQRPATPTHRPSPPPSKPSTPTRRSSTPTPRRMSTGSGLRGTSPIRTSRGNSASPKIRAWQSNIPGFSSEAPPNLRTSLADRPASYVRGSSPASRNGRDSSSKFGKQSMSPTPSRSISSSHSQDRDRISSQSKGSVASSGDDDVDSLQSIHVGSLDRSASKRVGAFPNNRVLPFSKKSTRMLAPSSAPKRSFDSALRQMDHQKSPQNMFRPLLSSVPSTTFYGGKASSAHRSLMSRNSSVTTSSNASSDQGTSVAPDMEGSDHHQEAMAIESGDVQEEVFAFDKLDAFSKGIGTDDGALHFQHRNFDKGPTIECAPGDTDEFGHQAIDMASGLTSDRGCLRADFAEVDSLENAQICSKCGCRYHVIETVEKDINLCPECTRQEDAITTDTTIVAAEDSLLLSMKSVEEQRPLMALPASQSQVIEMVEERVSGHEDNVDNGQTLTELSDSYSQDNSLTGSVMAEPEHRVAGQQGMEQPSFGYSLPGGYISNQQLLRSNDHPSLKVDVSEGAGITILLKRSSSSKGPFVQGRTFSASTITYDDLSCARDSVTSFRSSIGHGSASASSSVDFNSSRQVETRVHRQSSGRKAEMENYRYEINTRPQSTSPSLSGTFNQDHQALRLATSNSHEEHVEVFVGSMRCDGVEDTPATSHRKLLSSENKEMDTSHTSFACGAVSGEDQLEQNGISRLMVASACHIGIQLEENVAASFPNSDNFPSCENEEGFSNNAGSETDVEASAVPAEPEVERTMKTSPEGLDAAEVRTHGRLTSISEIEIETCCQSIRASENDDISINSKSTINEFQDPLVPTPSEKDMAASIPEHNVSDHVHGILEESTVMVDSRGGSKARSLTLEEATDTILFCSSIVQDLAYQAATIAIEKEGSVPLEGSRPTVTILGKPTADRKDPRGRITGKRSSKSLKVRQKRVETDVKHPSGQIENDENANESMVRNVGLRNEMESVKPPKLESKCNCTIM